MATACSRTSRAKAPSGSAAALQARCASAGRSISSISNRPRETGKGTERGGAPGRAANTLTLPPSARRSTTWTRMARRLTMARRLAMASSRSTILTTKQKRGDESLANKALRARQRDRHRRILPCRRPQPWLSWSESNKFGWGCPCGDGTFPMLKELRPKWAKIIDPHHEANLGDRTMTITKTTPHSWSSPRDRARGSLSPSVRSRQQVRHRQTVELRRRLHYGDRCG